jgi:hypothetical protein
MCRSACLAGISGHFGLEKRMDPHKNELIQAFTRLFKAKRLETRTRQAESHLQTTKPGTIPSLSPKASRSAPAASS